MKLLISNIAWDAGNDDLIYSYLSKLGNVYLEVAPTKLNGYTSFDDIDFAKSYSDKLYENFKLRIFSMQSILYGRTENIFSSVDDRMFLKDYIKKIIIFSRHIGCSNIVFGSPKNRNNFTGQDVNEVAISFFKELGDFAKANGVTISLEPNPKIYGTNFLNTTKEAISFIREVNSYGIKLNLDLGAIIENKERLDNIINDCDIIGHVHISEPYLEVIKSNELHHELIYKLVKNGYSNNISIEMKNTTFENIKNTISEITRIIHAVENRHEKD